MTLIKYKIGELIEQRREKYNGLEILPIKGVTKDGFIPPKQKIADTSIYNVFYKDDFVFNPARMELNSICLNTDFDKAICSSLYEVFYVKRKNIILPKYLNLFIKREEFSRKCWFCAVGSARNYFRVSDLSEFEIYVPSIEIQKKYIAIYDAMVSNLKSYEKGLDDLKLAQEILFNKNKRKNSKFLKNIIKSNNKNNDGFKVDYSCLRGINENCEFNSTRDSVKPNQIDKYRLIPRGSFAINFMCLGNFGKFYLAFNDTSSDVIVSPACNGFDIISSEIDPYYLIAYLRRNEFQRRCVFAGAGNTRGGINFDDFSALEIGVPNIDIQKSIGCIYRLYDLRRKNMEFLKNKITNLCPILIKGSILDAQGRKLI